MTSMKSMHPPSHTWSGRVTLAWTLRKSLGERRPWNETLSGSLPVVTSIDDLPSWYRQDLTRHSSHRLAPDQRIAPRQMALDGRAWDDCGCLAADVQQSHRRIDQRRAHRGNTTGQP